jgi:hypothetical protein
MYAAHHAAEKKAAATARCRAKKKLNDPVKAILQNMLWDSRKRAKAKGLEHTLTISDLYELFTATCPISGVDLLWQCGHGKPQDTSPSLDRLDPTLGYTPDNVWLISYRMNRIKNDATLAELSMILNAVSEKTLRSSSS